MYLIDTNVISETRRARPHGSVLAWFNLVANEALHISAVTIGEIQIGIEATRETDFLRADQLELWLAQISDQFSILPMDAEIFRIWAKLMHRQQNHLSSDAMLAATAKQHDLTIVTRNTKDFAKFGVKLFNPFLKA